MMQNLNKKKLTLVKKKKMNETNKSIYFNLILASKRNQQNKNKIEEIQLTSPNENTPSKQENIKSGSENL